MSLKINTRSAFSFYPLQKNQSDLSDSLHRLSSGKKINKASDNAAGMVIANKLAGQSDGFAQAVKNVQDAVSITQVADSALGQAVDLVQDIRIKAIQAASAAQSPESRQAIQTDIAESLATLTDIAQNTSFNNQKLLSGEFVDKTFQVGASSGETIQISIGTIDPSQISDETLGTLSGIDVTTQGGAQAAIELTDVATAYLSLQQSRIGSNQSRLESTLNNLSNSMVNSLAAESQIRDLDYAEESVTLNTLKLKAQANAFAKAQADSRSKKVLDVFG